MSTLDPILEAALAVMAPPSNVVNLPVRTKPIARDIGSQFFCTRCDVETFRLYSNGTVRCSQCGALIRNLLVTTK